jgi:hypothetical protein
LHTKKDHKQKHIIYIYRWPYDLYTYPTFPHQNSKNMQEPNFSYPFTEPVGSFAEQLTSEDALKMGQMAACWKSVPLIIFCPMIRPQTIQPQIKGARAVITKWWVCLW